MKLHEKVELCRETLNGSYLKLNEILSRMDRKTGQPDGEGEYSSMVNWSDIRGELLELRNRCGDAVLLTNPKEGR